MRALLVGGSPEGDADIVADLAASADRILAVDSGGSLCLAAGVVPTMVVGDLDSLPKASSESLGASGVAFEVHPAEKDETDLDLAVIVARRWQADEIILTAVLGGRLDHSLGTLGTLVRAADLRPIVLERDISACVLESAGRRTVAIQGIGATFSVVALGEGAQVSIVGVRWPLTEANLEPLSTLGVSNVLVEETAEVSVHSGVAAVLAPRVGSLMARFALT